MNEAELKDILNQHLAGSNISPLDYLLNKSRKLEAAIKGRWKIYLDSRYWVLLRDADMGRPRRVEHTEILGLIRGLVESGLAICPMSDAAYLELMQQTDPVTRVATAKLIDEFSLGVALCTEKFRVESELRRFMELKNYDMEEIVLRPPVWVKCGLVLWSQLPVVEEFTGEMNEVMQKTLIDMVWNQTSVEIDSEVGARVSHSGVFGGVASDLNDDKDKYAHEIRSKEQAFTAEIEGCLKPFKNCIAELIIERHKAESGGKAELSSAEADELFGKIVPMFGYACKKRPDRLSRLTPTLYVLAICHAAIRWDKARRYDGHWIFDIHHAAAAVGYFDVMFTENPLRVLLTGWAALDEEFGIEILSDEGDIIACLKKLSTKDSAPI